MMHQFIDAPMQEEPVLLGLAGGLAVSLTLWSAILAGASALLA